MRFGLSLIIIQEDLMRYLDRSYLLLLCLGLALAGCSNSGDSTATVPEVAGPNEVVLEVSGMH